MIPNETLERWTIERAKELYQVREWGNGYFDVSASGELHVNLAQGKSVSLPELCRGLEDRGFSLPILLRFSDLLDFRISMINETFRDVIREYGYQGEYRGVFPIKVNQQQQVVEEIVRFGARYHHGLEAGSKAELIAALAYLHDPQAYFVCNGYKDDEFIDLALYARKMGLHVVLVLETPAELKRILERAAATGVRPSIGVRLKISARGGGKWSQSGGDRSVFGLNAAQIIDVVDALRANDMLDCLHMLHYHLGSQIPNITHIRSAITEAATVYVDLVKEGAPMGALDIGGGLAVDYDGSHTNFSSSRNYDTREYCADVVEAIQAAVDEAGVPHPVIISESGRSVIAHYSVLLFNILEVSRFQSHDLPEAPPENAPEEVDNLYEVSRNLSEKNVQESYHDAVYYRDQVRQGFVHGTMTLRQRAMAEQLFWHILLQVAKLSNNLKYVPDEIADLKDALADIYYSNFSVFQSLPDAWAIQQLFPILPIHRLNEPPSRLATLSDITCDCDGKIDRFVDLHDVRKALPLHELREGEDYVLGAFLVGAYQETLGDLHNLFGDTSVVTIRVDREGNIEYAREMEGDSVEDVLSYVEYEPKQLTAGFRELAERAVKEGRLSPRERRQVVDSYLEGLRGYTYFET